MRPPGRSVFALRFPQRRNNPTYESISGNYVPIPRPRRRSLSGWLLSGIACLTLAGCSAGFSPHTAEGTAAPGQAQHQVADFVAVDCADIWAHSSDASDKNPLYWLRGIDCADRLAPAQARAEAKRHTDDSWQDAFRRGILLADAKITPEERRDLGGASRYLQPANRRSGPPAVSALARRPDPSAAAGGRACPLR